MTNFNMIRMRSYLEHLVIGTAAILIGFGVCYGILEEMVTMYTDKSRYAYIWGIIFTCMIILLGVVYIVKAAHLNKRIFKHLSQDERRQFFVELNQETTLFFDSRLIITPHFVVAYDRSWRAHIHILKMDDLVACFGKSVYGSNDAPDSYHLIIFDRKFQKVECVVKGDKAEIMDKGYQALLSLSPWVFSDNAEEFLNSYHRKSREKAYLKEIELRRRETEVDDDTLPMAVITAADIIRQYNERQKDKTKTPSSLKEGARAIFHKNDDKQA